MSPKLRRLSGRDVVAALEKLGFRRVSQRGSHVKLRRITDQGERQTLTIPLHAEIDTATLRAIVTQASKYVSERELRPYFYSN